MFCDALKAKGDEMTASAKQVVAPIALGAEEGEAYWAFGALMTIKASGATTGGRVAVIEHLAVQGAGSPMHVHRNEDEWFYITEGEVTFWVDGKVVKATAGSFVYGPREVPHTFLVTSAQARFLLVAEPAGFEDFICAVATLATSRTLPPADLAPPDMGKIMAEAAKAGIEITGPPGIPG